MVVPCCVPGTVILCADGSDLATRALAAGLAITGSDLTPIVVTVAEEVDPMLLTGTGIAGGTMSGESFERLVQERRLGAGTVVRETAQALHLDDVETRVLEGAPGPALCAFASEVSARAIVIGSRGRGGLKRALLGSVSDYVVRNAPCPVVVTGDLEGDD